MKSLIFSFCFCLTFASGAFAEDVGVKVNDIKTDQDSSTTIQVKKGSLNDTVYELTNGSDQVEGESAPLLKEARENWKKACSEWKSETKSLNKDNQMVALNCGHMDCTTSESESTCTSTGTYKVKVRVKN